MFAFYLANEKVLRRLKGNAAVLVTATRDAVLSTQEGRALVDAVLPPKPGTSGSLRARLGRRVSSARSETPHTQHLKCGMAHQQQPLEMGRVRFTKLVVK